MDDPLSPFALCTLTQIWDFLKISAASAIRDNFLVEQINAETAWIEREAGRFFVAREVEQYLDGSGNSTLRLPHYPVLTIITLWDDPDKGFDDSTNQIIKPTDRQFVKETGTLRVWNRVGAFSKGRQNIWARYVAGWADLDVSWESNRLDFNEGGATISVVIPPGKYDAVSLGSTIAKRMTESGTNTYQLNYDANLRTYRFTLATGATGTLNILSNTGPNVLNGVYGVLGMSTAVNRTGATGYAISTMADVRVPSDIELACRDLVIAQYDMSEFGGGSRTGNVKTKQIGVTSITYDVPSGSGGRQISIKTQATIDKYTSFFLD